MSSRTGVVEGGTLPCGAAATFTHGKFRMPASAEIVQQPRNLGVRDLSGTRPCFLELG